MQLFCADTAMFSKKKQSFLSMKTWKKRLQKVLIISPNFFSVLAQKQKFHTTKSPLMQNWGFRLGFAPYFWRYESN